MNNNPLFAVAAVYDNPDKIISAVTKIANSGYRKFDVNTPYPLHGMDGAMKLKSSKLGFITLFFGLTGAATALLLAWWTLSVDYPLIIGGKPFFALPAFIPVTFELTVLLATVSTVICMLTFFFRFPANSYPIHDTQYMKDVSGDKFGVYVEAADSRFDLTELTILFNETGAVRIDQIYLPAKEVYPLFQPKFLWFLFSVFVITSIITYFSLNKLMYMEPFDWMADQQKQSVQKMSVFYSDEFGMRTPVKGTVARGFIPYKYLGQAVPSDTMKNPLPPTSSVLELGKKKFLTFCSPCHGNFADGDSRLRGQFVNPPSLHTSRARTITDGFIYHIITNGQNAMPSYSSQVTREERWSIINYLRVLQKAKNASDADLKMAKKESVSDGK